MAPPVARPTSGFIRIATSVVCAIALVSGCGGGGGDDSAVATLDFPVANAVAVYSQSAHQFNLIGTVGGDTLSMSYSYTPGAPGTFEGLPASTAVEAATLSRNGVVIAQLNSTSFFALAPYRVYGASEPGSYSVFTQTANLPATARIGQSGAIGTETEYTDGTKLVVLGTSNVTWSLETDTASTALFCVNIQATSGLPVNGSQCYRVDANGVTQGLVLRVDLGGGQIVTLS